MRSGRSMSCCSVTTSTPTTSTTPAGRSCPRPGGCSRPQSKPSGSVPCRGLGTLGDRADDQPARADRHDHGDASAHGPAGIEFLKGEATEFMLSFGDGSTRPIYVTGDTVWFE